ncbi:SRPBCC family protein [Aquincola sp. MAHUQ-54]|uniref:SRPBCC family protein n=1 Tax=Aquincola agrisoli TaxID=3119538 RepID=A0AAW9QDQ9_9BURK
MTLRPTAFSRRRAALACALLLSPLCAAWAHGPTPQRIDEQIEVAAPPAKVWALVGDFAHFARWNPALAASEADKGNTPGSRRTLRFAQGGQAAEELDDYSAAEMSLSYRSGREVDPAVLPASSYSARLRVLPAGSGSRIEFRARAYRADTRNDPAKGQDDAAAVKALQEYIKPALARAKEALEKG